MSKKLSPLSSNNQKKNSIKNELEKSISESDYINIIIIHNINENQIFTAFSLKKIFGTIKISNYKNLLLSFHNLCNSPESYLFLNLKGKEYLGAIFYITLFILEEEKIIEKLKDVFLTDIILLVKKLFLSKKLNIKDILLLAKFISFTSIHERKEITQNNVELLMKLSNNLIKNYKKFELALKLIQEMNIPNITYEFCKFLNKDIFGNKKNLFLFLEKIDLLKFLLLDDEEDKIIDFLSEIFTFKYNRHFLEIFMDQIKSVYDIKNKNNNSIVQILNSLNKSISFIIKLKVKEEQKYENEPYILSKAFYCTNSKNNGFFVKDIQIQHNLSIIFSFCFSRKSKIKKDNKEYPIINFIEEGKKNEKNGLYFLIKNGIFHLKNFFHDKKLEILKLKENQIYICFFSIKEKNFFNLQIFAEGNELVKQKNKFSYELKKNVDIIIGKNNTQNFEGYIGPILIFKKYFEEIPLIFLNLKGFYEYGLYYSNNINTDGVDIYHIIKNDKDKENEEVNIKEDLSKSLIAYITPLDKGQILKNKLYYYNTTFIKTKINFYIEPNLSSNSNYFIYNNFTIFEFIKYDGLYYIVFIFELITTNIDNVDNNINKSLLINIFKNLINLIIKIIDSINIENFVNEIRCIFFALKKCVIEICKKFKITQEIIENLKLLINFLTSQDTENIENNYIFLRNEIFKFLLDFDLYDLNNFYSIECFLDALNSSLNMNCYGLISMDIFRKIMNFAVIYDENFIQKNKDILHSDTFKSLKHELNDTLINYLSKSVKIQPYNEIFQIFSKKYDFNYKNYQFFKIFYLSSENFFNKENNKSILPVLKYFIDLFEYLDNNDFSNLIPSLKKEKYIIMSICLRFCLEYALIENLPKIKNKTTKEISEIDSEQGISRLTVGPGNKNLLSLEKDNLSDDFEIIEKLELKDIIATDEPSEGGTDVSNNEHNSDNTDKKSSNTPKSCEVKKIKRKNSNENLLLNNKKGNKISENSYYYDYFEINSLIEKISKSKQINDYCFKSLLLFILEKNNDVFIEQRIKYRFIIKTKNFNDLKHKDYDSFLKIKYYNEETKDLILKLIDLLEKENHNLGRICYELIIYILIQTAKERPKNKCPFNHIFSSRKTCQKFFLICLQYNADAFQTLVDEFHNILNLVIPYHNNNFIFSFLFNCMKHENLKKHSVLLINKLLKTKINKEENIKMFYIFKIKCVIFLYRIIKSKDDMISNNFILEEKSLIDLFDADLFSIKFNILKDISNNRKKTYAEILFEVLIYLHIKTKNKNYFDAINDIFITNNYIKNIGDSKSILYHLDIDTVKSKISKNSQIIKILKNYDIIEDKYYTLTFLYKSLKYWIKAETIDLRNNIKELIKNFFIDSNLFYKENKIKKIKTKNELQLYIKELLEENINKNKYKNISIEEIAIHFKAKYYDYQKKKGDDINSHNSKKSFLNFFGDSNNYQPANDINNNTEKKEQDDSFSSCNSSKSIKEQCKINKKRRMNLKKKKNFYGDEETILNTEKDYNIEENDLIDEEKNNSNEKIKIKNTDKNLKNCTQKKLKNNFILNDIDSPDKVILFPKLSLLEQIFAVYFTEIFFYNEPFINMKNYFKYRLKKNYSQEISIDNYFNYPIITRNYIPNKLYFGGLFIKHDLNFFANRYFHISHPYFINKAKESKIKRIFPKISEQNEEKINFLINDKNEKKFIVDLVTNRSVYFGELIINKNLIYFHKLDKDKYFKDKDDSEVEKYLLSSPLCDYSNKNKKLFIFKKEITEIINRRFLYSFQACEIYLKNGKSYYFNMYSEEKKIEFFSLFSNKEFNPYEIKIISDLKTEFKKKDFTHNWLNNKITTLEYLLFINKYSCRSYNDINQYPVFPWLRILGDKIRDLKNTIAAQTEDSRMMLKEKYLLSSETFPFHYTTHYSNSSFLLYYLVRINPFTDNQITLQNNRFDSPGRQFNSIDELQKVLSTTSQPREIIPEFFITTEFYYNYNCNFYGFKNKTYLINNLENKSGYDTPLDYILSNAVRLESPECKSEINFFFDNVFGVGQMGGQDKCNTYDKYSYQEMIDLKMKIENYKKKNMNLKEIKDKIDMKANKIISFGQTPFKLLEDKHPQWIENNKENKENNLYNIIESYYSLSIPNKIIFIDGTKNNNKKYLYALIYNPEEKINNYELKIFELNNLKEDTSKSIKIPKKIKFFSKLRLFPNNNNYIYKYNPKLSIIDFSMSVFILTRLNDSTICLYNSKGESKIYLTESVVTCIAKTSEKSFLTGHLNGKILEWKFNIKNLNTLINDQEVSNNHNINLLLDELKVHRRFIAHREKIGGIIYSELMGLIITWGDDKKIMIRKYYDLSLLTMIDFSDKNKFCIDIKISHCFLYILFFDEIEKKQIVQVYSVNGLKVGEGNYNYINCINIDKIGNIYIGNYLKNKIEIYSPSMTRKLDEIILETKIDKKNNKKGNKKNSEKNENNNEIYFNDFYVDKDNNAIYSCFSNGLITKINYKCNYE